jgi:hypothetical protein
MAQSLPVRCTKCGTHLEPSAKFCGNCGNPIGASPGAWLFSALRYLTTAIGVIVAIGFLYFRLEIAPQHTAPNDLGIAVSINSDGKLQSGAGYHAAQVIITNLKNEPITIQRITFNRATTSACVKQPNQTIAGGGTYSVFIGGAFGECGIVQRIAMETSRGNEEYTFDR